MFKVITGTLQANHNTMQLTDDTITNDSIFEVYADTENVIPSSVSVGGHTVTVTFDSKPSSNVGIKVLINNIVGEYTPSAPESSISYHDATGATGLQVGYIQKITGTPPHPVITPVYNGVGYEELVPLNTVNGGVLYHSTTGNIWKKLDASNLDYDNNSTIYSAMGDIDELETQSTNLVDAINEVNSRPSGGLVFSTTPVVVGKFGNKNLYCKYITGDIIGGDFKVPHNIENLDLIIDYDVYRYTTDSNKWLWKAYGRGTNRSYNIIVNGVNATDFDITVSGWTSGHLRIVIYYTINE